MPCSGCADIDQAIDILTEARTLWPADDQVGLRLGTALMMANRSAEALKVLEPYLAAHPADHERLLLALRALYEARSARARHRDRRQRQSAVHPLRRRLRRWPRDPNRRWWTSGANSFEK